MSNTINPWDLKTDEKRQVDSLYTFLIFCEDQTSEVIYFKSFETDNIKINVFPNQKSMLTNVIKAIAYCKDKNIYDDKGDVVDGYEIWCVYDRDKTVNSEILQSLEHDVNFNVAYETALNHKINVAWSNDAFELWVLLHLQDIDIVNPLFNDRSHYYNILTDYFTNHSTPNISLKNCLQHPTFCYKKDLKHKNNFREIVLVEILPFTNLAIQRATNILDQHKETQQLNYAGWSPCTLVHNLVESLIKKGEKI